MERERQLKQELSPRERQFLVRDAVKQTVRALALVFFAYARIAGHPSSETQLADVARVLEAQHPGTLQINIGQDVSHSFSDSSSLPHNDGGNPPDYPLGDNPSSDAVVRKPEGQLKREEGEENIT